MTALYYEAHVTIEPVFDQRLTLFREVCVAHQFRAADLLMKKRGRDQPHRSQHDTFATGRNISLPDLVTATRALIADLRTRGYQVWRYKLEDTLLDSREQGDKWGLLG